MSRASAAEILGSISPTARGVGRGASIVAALMPPAKAADGAIVKAERESASSAVLKFVPGLAGAGVGALVWKKHRVLGALLGHAVVGNVLPIVRGGADRKRAMCQLGVEGAGIAGSLLWDEHPIFGWGAGILAGAAVTAFIKGSPTNELWKKWSSEIKK